MYRAKGTKIYKGQSFYIGETDTPENALIEARILNKEQELYSVVKKHYDNLHREMRGRCSKWTWKRTNDAFLSFIEPGRFEAPDILDI